MSIVRLQICWLIACSVTGCSLPVRWNEPDSARSHPGVYDTTVAKKTVYVLGHGWHTGLVLQKSDVSPEILPEIQDFADADFIELGWGDEGFYRARKITAPLVMKAAFWPTPSVLHVVGFWGEVEYCYQVSDIVEVELSDQQFDALCEFVSASFERDEVGAAQKLGPGIYGDSLFYRAQGKYYVPKTCNIWTAKALHAAGCQITPQLAITAENVLAQTRRIGRVRQTSPRGLKKAALRGTD